MLLKRISIKTLVVSGVLLLSMIIMCSILYEYFTSPQHQINKAFKKAQTAEQKEAIQSIQARMKDFHSHVYPAAECADLILSAEHNIGIIGRLTTNYVLQSIGGTQNYVKLARLAAKSPVATDEFITIAESMKKGGESKALAVAEKVSMARNADELDVIRPEIEALR